MKSRYSTILLFFALTNFNLSSSGEISSKIDFTPGSDHNRESKLNSEFLKTILNANRDFVQDGWRGGNYNFRRSPYRLQNGNFMRNDMFPSRGQGNTGRNTGNKRPVINYIRVFMNGQNPNPCQDESCTLTLVKRQIGNGRILTEVYINMDASQINTDGGEAITIRVTPLSQNSPSCGSSGNCYPNGQYGPNEQECLSGNCNSASSMGCSSNNCPSNPQGCSSGDCSENPPNVVKLNNNHGQTYADHHAPFFGNPRQFWPSPGGLQHPFGPLGLQSYPQRVEFSSGPPVYSSSRGLTSSKEIIDDKIISPLSKTNNEPDKA